MDLFIRRFFDKTLATPADGDAQLIKMYLDFDQISLSC